MPAQLQNVETKDNNSFGFAGKTQRAQVGTDFVLGMAVTTTITPIFTMDSAAMGGVNYSLTVQNRSGSANSVRIYCYVSNDNGKLGSNAGRITLANAFDETDTTQSLPFTIAAGATKHLVLSYKEQPIYTTFRFWQWAVDVATGSATIDAFACAK